jgi:enoyl-CoA hydratase/carnithine racemase
MLTGDAVDVHAAERYGLVNFVVPRHDLDTAALTLAKKIVARAPIVPGSSFGRSMAASVLL